MKLTTDSNCLAIQSVDFKACHIEDIESYPSIHGKYEWNKEQERSVSSIKDKDGNYHAHALGYKNGWGEWEDCIYKDGKFDKADLAIALFDAREMEIIPHVDSVELPNGETFYIDADYGQDAKMEADWGAY